MPATALTPTTRYYRPGKTKVIFATTVASKASPTRAEINAGQDLSAEINAVDGWSVVADFIDTPDLGTTFTAKIAGSTSADSSSLTFYMDSASTDVRTLFTRGTTGFILFMDEGEGNPKKMDVFPVTVASQPKQRGLGDPAMIQIQFVVTSVPVENVTIPT